jgi:hypothetical protein
MRMRKKRKMGRDKGIKEAVGIEHNTPLRIN